MHAWAHSSQPFSCLMLALLLHTPFLALPLLQDYNRVKLNGHGYVNGSQVVHVDKLAGLEFSYVATQGPLQSTIADFWRMVLEQRIPAVIMLTNIVERNVVKCAQYFPEQEVGHVHFAALSPTRPSIHCMLTHMHLRALVPHAPPPPHTQGQRMVLGNSLEVTSIKVTRCHAGQMTARTITVRILEGRSGSSSIASSCSGSSPHTVQHYQYHAWPDHGTPQESKPIRALCEVMQQEREQGLQQQQLTRVGSGGLPSSPPPPPQAVVHCSAGIGRTGTLVAIDILRQRLHRLASKAAEGSLPPHTCSKKMHEALNLPALVHELRQQRAGMVQTFEVST